MILKRLRELREEYGYTQKYIAHVLKVEQRTYSRYETGERQIPISALIILANLYNTSIDYIVGRIDIK